MNETEEIFALMPEGYFSDAQELQKVIDSDGLESIYGLLPEGYFESQEEFVNTYGQKKSSVDTESVSEDGSLEQASSEEEVSLMIPEEGEPPSPDEDLAETVRNLRRGVSRKNVGGGRSTVKMADMEVDGKYVAIPTLFPKDPNNFGPDPEDWVEFGEDDAMGAYDMAVERGEVFEFNTPEEASAFAQGSWKEEPPVETDGFEDAMGYVTSDLIDRSDVGQVSRQLNSLFSDYGFEIKKPFRLSSDILVTAENGEQMRVNANPGYLVDMGDEVSEALALRGFLEENRGKSKEAIAREGVEVQVQAANESVKKFNAQNDRFLEAEKNLKNFIAENGTSLTEEKMKEYEALFADYESSGDKLVKLSEVYEAEKMVADMVVEDFEKSYGGEKLSWIEEELGKNNVTNLIADFGVRAVNKGFAQGGTIRSSRNLMTNANDVTDEDIKDFLLAQKVLQEQGMSDEFIAFLEYAKKDGEATFASLAAASAKYPEVLPELFITSAIAMGNREVGKGAFAAALAGGAAGLAGLSLGPFGALTTGAGFFAGLMGGAGYALESGLSFGEFLGEEMAEKQGVSLDEVDMSVDKVREVLSDEEAMSRINLRANGRGIAIGATNLLGGVAAAKTVMAVGKAVKRFRRPLSMIAGGAVGMAGESASESIGRFVANQAQDKTDIYLEGAAMGPTTVAGIAIGLAKQPKYTLNDEVVSGRAMARFIRESSESEVTGATIEIKNDNDLLNEARDKRQTAQDKAIIKSQLRDSGVEEDKVDALADLELRKRKLKGMETTAAQRKRARIQLEIDAILDGDAYFFEETTDKQGRKTTNEVRVTRRDAIMALLMDDIPNPTETEIEAKLAELFQEAMAETKKSDAVQEQSTEEVSTRDETEAGPEVGGQVQDEQEVAPEDEAIVDEEAAALEEQLAAEGTDDIDVEEDDVIIRRRDGSKLSKKQDSIVKKAKARIKSLKGLGVKIVLHQTSAQFGAATGGRQSRGYYDTRGEFGDKKTIHVNLETANSRTVAHEAFHAMFLERVMGGDLEARTMAISAMQTIRKAVAQDKVLAERIDFFLEAYEADIVDEEALAEIFGYINEGYGKLTPVQRSGVKAAISDLVYKITGIQLGETWTENDQNVLDLFNTLSEKLEAGEEITQEDLSGLDVSEERKAELESKGLLKERLAGVQSKRKKVQSERDALLSPLTQLANEVTDVVTTAFLNSLSNKIGVSRIKSLEKEISKVIKSDKLTNEEKSSRLDALEKKVDSEVQRIAKVREAAKEKIASETERLTPKVNEARKRAKARQEYESAIEKKKKAEADIRRRQKEVTSLRSKLIAQAKRKLKGEELKAEIESIEAMVQEERDGLIRELAEARGKKKAEPTVEAETAPVDDVAKTKETLAEEKEKLKGLKKKLAEAKRDLKAFEAREEKKRGRKERDSKKKAVADIESSIQDASKNIKELEAEVKKAEAAPVEEVTPEAPVEEQPTVATIRTKVGVEAFGKLEAAVRDYLEYMGALDPENMTRGQRATSTRRVNKVVKLATELGLTEAEQAVMQNSVQENIEAEKRAAEAKDTERAELKAAAERAKREDTLRTLNNQLIQATRELLKLESMGATESMKAQAKNAIAAIKAEIDSLMDDKPAKAKPAVEEEVTPEVEPTVDTTTGRKLTDSEIEHDKIFAEALARIKGLEDVPYKDRDSRLVAQLNYLTLLREVTSNLSRLIINAESAGEILLVQDLRQVRANAGQAIIQFLDQTESMDSAAIDNMTARFDANIHRFENALKTENLINAFEKNYVEPLGKSGVVLRRSSSTGEASPFLKEYVESLPYTWTDTPERQAAERRAPEKKVVKAKPAAKKAAAKKPAPKKPAAKKPAPKGIVEEMFGPETEQERAAAEARNKQSMIEMRAEVEGISVEEVEKKMAREAAEAKLNVARSEQRKLDALKGKKDKKSVAERKNIKQFIEDLKTMSVEEARAKRQPSAREQRVTPQRFGAADEKYLSTNADQDIKPKDRHVILYHKTSAESADAIAQEGFSPSLERVKDKGDPSDLTWFTDTRRGFGDSKSLVAVQVPESRVKNNGSGVFTVYGNISPEYVEKVYHGLEVDATDIGGTNFRAREDILRDFLSGNAKIGLKELLESGKITRFAEPKAREQKASEVLGRYKFRPDGSLIGDARLATELRGYMENFGFGVEQFGTREDRYYIVDKDGNRATPKQVIASDEAFMAEREAEEMASREAAAQERINRRVEREMRREELRQYGGQYVDFSEDMLPPSVLSGREQRESIIDATKGLAVDAVVKFAKERGFSNEAILKVRPEAQEAIDKYESRLARVNKELDGVLKRTEERSRGDKKIQAIKSKGLRKAKLRERQEEAALEYLRDTKIYEEASDIGREAMEIAVMKKVGRKIKSSPTPQTILNIDDGGIDKVLLKEKIRAMARSSRATSVAMRALMKQLGKDAAALKRDGILKPIQAAMLLKRMGEVNPFNEVSVDRFLDFTERIFLEGEYAGDLKAILDNRSRALKQANTKLGVSQDITPMVNTILRTNPSMLPDVEIELSEGEFSPLIKEVRKLAEELGKRKAVLSVEERTKMQQRVFEIAKAIDEELSLKNELMVRYQEYTDAQSEAGVTEKLTVSKIIDGMESEGIIDSYESSVLKKYKAELREEPTEEEKAEREKAEEERRKILMDEIAMLPKLTQRFSLREENELVRRFNKGVKSEFVKELSTAELTNILRVADNIQNGFVPHMTQILVEKINAHEKAEAINKNINDALPTNLLQLYNKIVEGAGLRSLYKRAMRNPTVFFDQVVGNYKGKPLYNAVYKDLASAHALYKSEILNIQDRLRKLDNLLIKKGLATRSPNAVARAKFEVGAYMMQLEFENNPNMRGIHSAQALLAATIERSKLPDAREMKNYSPRQAQVFQDILNDIELLVAEEKRIAEREGREERPISELMRDGAGKIKPMLSPQQITVAKGIRNINDELTPKAQYVAGVIRGIPFQSIAQYFHRVVFAEQDPTNDTKGPSQVLMNISANAQPSTRGKNMIQRQSGKAPAVNFDPFVSANRGAKFTLVDYHLTEPIRTARRVQNLLQKKKDRTIRQGEIVRFINNSLSIVNEHVLGASIGFDSETERMLEYAKKFGYRSALGSVKRSVAELTSNALFSLVAYTSEFISGVKNHSKLIADGGSEVMRNVKSVQVTRLFPQSDVALKSGVVDQIKDATNPSGTFMRTAVGNIGALIWQNSFGKIQRFYDVTADSIITRPDQMVNRPIWFGAFAKAFKKASGKEVDFDAIRDNSEQYMSDNRDAIKFATDAADDASIRVGATDNPYLGIVSAMGESKRSEVAKALAVANSYMTRFMVFEYVASRTAIQAMKGNGMISRMQGLRLFGAVTARMISYTLVYRLIKEQISRLYKDDDDFDEEQVQRTVSTAIGSAVINQAMGTRGQLFRGTAAIGIEYFNEELHEEFGLPFEYTDRLSFPLIDFSKSDKPAEQLLGFAGRLAGPLSFAPKMALTGLRAAAPGDTEGAKIRRDIEQQKFLLQVLGSARLVPFYTDALYDFQQYKYQIYDPNYGLTEIEKRLKEFEERMEKRGLK
jgi:hypothetical protein